VTAFFFSRPLSLAVPLLCLGLAGCGSSAPPAPGELTTSQKMTNLFLFQSTTLPQPSGRAPERDPNWIDPPEDEDETLICPQVIVADGGAAIRAQSGPDSSSLRHQISIINVARECKGTGRGGFTLKVGVEGRALLGPAGGAGNYGATLTTQVLRGSTVVARRSARVGATIPAGQGGADFVHVEDGIVVPPGGGDVEIIVGLGQGGATPARSRRR
jgi:hypothetical protein